MTPPASRIARQAESKPRCATTATRVVLSISASVRSRSNTLSGAAASATTCASFFAPRLLSWTSSSARDRDTRQRAASDIDRNAAAMTSTPATTSMTVSAVVIAPASSLSRLGPGLQEPRLQREHLLFLGRLAVVIAEQMQHAVRAQQVQLVLGAVTCRQRLRSRDVRAEHYVIEQRRRRVFVVVGVVTPVVQLVHGKGEYVGGAGLIHEVLVQRRHRGNVDKTDRQLDQRMHAHLVEDEARELFQREDVDVHTGLVGHLDGHG